MAFGMTKWAFVLTVVMLGMAPGVCAQTLPVPPRDTPAQTPTDAPANSLSSVQQDIPYGTAGGHPLLLDIYQPSEQSSALRPAVVLIHGGGWTSFDKSTMHTMGMFLARCGFVAFAVDYRLMHGSENIWPAQLDDVQRAVRWVRANAAKYRVDPDHIGAFGHSAGAQLASLLGMEDTRDNSDAALAKYSSRVQAVVEVSGPSDFTIHRDADDDAFLATFFGGDYAQRSKVWQDASPAFHVSKNVSPFLIMHGTQDADVPIAQSQELAEKLQQAGASVKFVTVDDAHTFRTPEARKRLALETQAFFTQYLRPGDLK
ncbi:MAG: alpha/beta hydrolase [Candidatus Sulfotelmatobacter sp.]|jgi:acetyl esterase/lipase